MMLTIRTGNAVAERIERNSTWAGISTFGLVGMLLPFGWRKGRRVKSMVAVLGLMFVGLYVGGCAAAIRITVMPRLARLPSTSRNYWRRRGCQNRIRGSHRD